MTIFNVTPGNMFNIIVIAAGIGICGMNILQVSTGARLSKEATRYFQLFFGQVILYIGSHLARQLMEGIPGQGIRIALVIVTLLEFFGFRYDDLPLFTAYAACRKPGTASEQFFCGCSWGYSLRTLC
ncbi:MAG: hypothetical protein IJG94_11325 [Clostridia bacterium]|nr:hypothetical protein [Clostridia bacterium]